jgi:Ca-activated chloride channel family protein
VIKKFCTVVCILFTVPLYAQKTEGSLNKGNEYYKQAQFDLAEKQYRAARAQNNGNTTAQYNLANALIEQKKYREATDILGSLLKAASDKEVKAAAFYNQGVIYTKERELEASIEAYKASLRINPADKEVRENLQKALLELKKQQQQKQQQQKQQQQNQSNMSKREAEQKLKALQEKEKKLQERLQNKGQKGNSMPKDW